MNPSNPISPGLVTSWSSKWTKDWLVQRLTQAQHDLLRQATSDRDVQSLLSKPAFKPVVDACADYIQKKHEQEGVGGVFVRLGTLSPKDVLKPGPRCTSVEEVFGRLTESFRCLEDLGDKQYAPCSLVLRPWDERIAKGYEYRSVVFRGKLEDRAIALTRRPKPESNDDKCGSQTPPQQTEQQLQSEHIAAIKQFVADHAVDFPSGDVSVDLAVYKKKHKEGEKEHKGGSALDVVFVEFNNLDAELDMYDQFANLSLGAQAYIHDSEVPELVPESDNSENDSE